MGTIGDYAYFQNGYAFKSKDFLPTGEYRVIKIKELKDGEVRFSNDTACVDYIDGMDKFIVNDGDVLFALTGDPVSKPNPLSWVGRVSLYRENYKTVLNQRVCKLIPKEGVNPQYLYYFFRNDVEFYQLAKKATGSASQANISTKTIEDTEINLPDLQYQNKVVDILSTLDHKIKNNEQINNNLSAQARAIFLNYFVNIASIPNGWQKGCLLDIANYLNGLAMQKYRPHNDEEGLHVLKIKELRQGSCDESSELCSPNIKPEYIISDGDVVFSWSGSLLIDIWCGGTCGLNQHLFKVTSDTYDKWFYYLWTSHHLDRFIAIAADKATTMGHIKREDLAKAEVLIPNETDYKEIGAVIKPLLELIISNRLEARKPVAIRDKLLPKLLSGEIDVSEVAL